MSERMIEEISVPDVKKEDGFRWVNNTLFLCAQGPILYAPSSTEAVITWFPFSFLEKATEEQAIDPEEVVIVLVSPENKMLYHVEMIVNHRKGEAVLLCTALDPVGLH